MSRAEGSAAVPNWMIRDKSVPRNAILVYASLSSRGGLGAIYPSQETIAEESGLSERTVRTMIQHLESLGVVHRERRKVPGMKRVTDAYTLHPNGNPVLAAEVAARRDLPADLPETKQASTGNQAQIVPLIEVDTREVSKGTPGFDEFWDVWPKKVAKPDALRAWGKAVKVVAAEQIIAAAIAYRDNPGIPPRQYIPYPARWLNRHGWNDDLPTGSEAPIQRAREVLDLGRQMAAERAAS